MRSSFFAAVFLVMAILSAAYAVTFENFIDTRWFIAAYVSFAFFVMSICCMMYRIDYNDDYNDRESN